LEALDREIERQAPESAILDPVDTVYFGGGTPSILEDGELGAILAKLRRGFSIEPGAEISIEANPDDLPDGRCARLRDLGIGRISIGIQSFDDRELAQLDRNHTAEAARRALREAAATPGIRSSADLMIGTPGQSAENFRRSVAEVIDSGSGHVSIYVLETDKPSKISREVSSGHLPVPPDDLIADLFLEACEELRRAGLSRYEASNFARPGEECRHNLRYWRRLSYLGLGPSAHSLMGEERFRNADSLPDYLRRIAAGQTAEVERARVSSEERIRELVFLGLRERRGVGRELVREAAQRLGRPAFSERLEEGVALGDVTVDGETIAFTDAGFLRMNVYLSELF